MEPVHAESDPLKVTHFRGFGILAFRATILAGLTPEQQELLLARLGPQCQELMRRPPGAEEWVPIEHLQEIRTVFSQLFGLRLDKVRGLTMASLLFSGAVFEPLKNTRNISLFLTKFPQIWATYHRGAAPRRPFWANSRRAFPSRPNSPIPNISTKSSRPPSRKCSTSWA